MLVISINENRALPSSDTFIIIIICLPNRVRFVTSDLILGYYHPAATGHLTKIVVLLSLTASYLALADSRSPLENT